MSVGGEMDVIEKTYGELKVFARPLLWPVRVAALAWALLLFGVTVSFMGARVLMERARGFLARLAKGYSGRVSGRRP